MIEALARTLEIGERAGATIEGAVTWAFTFVGAPFFAGYRELATNGIAKPVLNAIRMMAALSGTRVAAESSGRLPLDAILKDGVAGAADVDCLATRDGETVNVLVWNYHDDNLPAVGAVEVELVVGGLAGRYRVSHQRVDGAHANAHAAFLAMGAPQPPDDTQYAELKAASQPALLEPEETATAEDGAIRRAFTLPRHAVSLISLTPA